MRTTFNNYSEHSLQKVQSNMGEVKLAHHKVVGNLQSQMSTVRKKVYWKQSHTIMSSLRQQRTILLHWQSQW